MVERHTVIFDLDGTLVDTQELHAQGESSVLAHYGVVYTPEEITRAYAGRSDRALFEELVPDCDPDALSALKWELLRVHIAEHSPRAVPGMLTLVQTLARLGHPLAVASASPSDWIAQCLAFPYADPSDECGTTKTVTFGDYVGGNYVSSLECDHGKPHPDVFLRAYHVADGTAPLERCWVIEDGCAGVEAGLAAHMLVFFLSNETRFDHHPRVRRFGTSQTLAQHLCAKLEQRA